MEDYSKYFNKGNDCDACLHQFLIREDAVACRKELAGEDCDFIEVDESGNIIGGNCMNFIIQTKI